MDLNRLQIPLVPAKAGDPALWPGSGPWIPAFPDCEFSNLAIWHELNTLGLMVRRRAHPRRLEPWQQVRTRVHPSRRPRFARAPQDEVGVCERFTASFAGMNGD